MPSRRLSRPECRKILERDNYTCQVCKKQMESFLDVKDTSQILRDGGNFLVVDHVNGRSNDPENLQALCWKCNSAKAGKYQNAFRLSLALKRLGPCITYYPSLAAVVGLKESIFLCQLIYWTPRGRHEKGEGWIYKSVEEMGEETGLSYKEQLRVRQSLIDQGLLLEVYDRNEHRLYFKILADNLDKIGGQICGNPEHITDGHMPEGEQPPAQREAGTLPKVRSIKGSRDYSEITHKNITPILSLNQPHCDRCADTGRRPSISKPGVMVQCECQEQETA